MRMAVPQPWPGSVDGVRSTPGSPGSSVGWSPCGVWSVGWRPRSPSRTTRRATSATRSDREAELLEDRAGRGARAEVVDADDRPLVARVALPAQRDAGLDRDALPHGRRQDAVAVRLVLGLEPLPAGERDDAGRDAVGLERLGGAERELELRARRRSGSAPARRPRPRAGRTRRGARPRARAPSCPGRVGSFWRVSARATGPAVAPAIAGRSTASAQAAAVSFASPGRTNHRLGIARRAA